MGNYLDGFSSALGSTTFTELTFYALGVLIATVFLIVISRLIRDLVSRNVRGIGTFSMTFEDLERMRRTGLISDDEYQRAKSRIAGNIAKSLEKDNPNSEKASQALPSIVPLDSIKGLERDRVSRDSQTSPGASPGGPPRETRPPAPKNTGGKAPIDIDDLLQKGLITPEDYQQLSEISRKKGGET